MADGVGLVIGGEMVAGGEAPYPVNNPARPAEVVLDAPSASGSQLDEAVWAARCALPAWSSMEFDDRFAVITKAVQRAESAIATDELARLLTREHGKALWEAEFETSTLAAMAGAFAPLAEQALAGATHSSGVTETRIVKVPCGVVAAILPFNWPVAVFANKVLPALLTGNTVVAKAPPSCPGAVVKVAAAMAEELPPGALSVLNGPGGQLGEALVTHDGIDMVSFTGGVSTGRSVMVAAAHGVKPLVLELGGNDPAIVAPDVEIDDSLADKIFTAAFLTSGQVCMAIKRLFVPESRVGEMVEVLRERLAREVIGDGLAEGVTMGPVHTRSAMERVESMLAEAEASGARVHRPAKLRGEDLGAGGYLVSPAIVEGAADRSRIVAEEQFAPALPVLGYGDLDEAVERANESPYGLCSSVWTADGDLAEGLSSRLRTGTVFVNNHGITAVDFRAPFGGWKHSGFGEELGVEGMAAFTRSKTIAGLPTP